MTRWDLLTILVKASLYAATLAASGTVFFLGYSGSLIEDAERRRVRRLAAMLMVLALIASAALIFVTAASMSGDVSGLFDARLDGMAWGGQSQALIVRIAGLLAAATFGVSVRRPGALALTGAAVAATSFAWTGHAHATGAVSTVALMSIHLLGVAFWVGALGPLLMLTDRLDARRIAPAAHRFGTAAVAVVGALAVAGGVVLWRFLGGFAELWGTSYGRTACVKLGLVAVLLGFAALNKLRLTPRLLAGDARAVRNLRLSIEIELLLAGLILVATAALTTLNGAPALDR